MTTSPQLHPHVTGLGLMFIALGGMIGSGWLLLAPLPAWSELAGIVASATMLAGGIGVLGMGVLRRTYPDLNRPFRVPGGTFFCLVAFACSSLVVVWCGLPRAKSTRLMIEALEEVGTGHGAESLLADLRQTAMGV